MDPISHCTPEQLRAGGVNLQIMAFFCDPKPGAPRRIETQSRIYAALPKKHPDYFIRILTANELEALCTQESPPTLNKIATLAAIENATGFCEDHEPLADGFKRLDRLIAESGPFLYCTITWHGENRFGGGNGTSIGLKEDGKRLVEKLAQQRIAVDFSHTSDRLAEELLLFIDKQKLNVPVLASHSNFRSVCDHPRNLSDEIAQEILRRGGIIGLNFVSSFVGKSPDQFIEHWNCAKKLGALEQLVLGADFFAPDEDDFKILKEWGMKDFFFEGYDNASCYPRLLELLHQGVGLTDKQCADLSWNNLLNFVRRNLGTDA
jgi:microsomal dipeptidase-like Zn-dependent dipeptidase